MRGSARASDFSAQNSFFCVLHWQVCGYGEIKFASSILRVCVCLSFFSLLSTFSVFCDAHGGVLFEVLSRGSRLVCDNFSYFVRFFSLRTQNMTEANGVYINSIKSSIDVLFSS